MRSQKSLPSSRWVALPPYVHSAPTCACHMLTGSTREVLAAQLPSLWHLCTLVVICYLLALPSTAKNNSACASSCVPCSSPRLCALSLSNTSASATTSALFWAHKRALVGHKRALDRLARTTRALLGAHKRFCKMAHFALFGALLLGRGAGGVEPRELLQGGAGKRARGGRRLNSAKYPHGVACNTCAALKSCTQVMH